MKVTDISAQGETAQETGAWQRIAILERENRMLREKLHRLSAPAHEINSETLCGQKEFISRVADASPDLIGVQDLLKKKFLYMNRRCSEMFGDMTGVTSSGLFRKLVHPDDLRRLTDYLRSLESLGDNEVREIEYRVKDQQGQIRWLHARDTVFKREDNGYPCQLLTIASDVTQRKLVEEELHKGLSLLRKAEKIGQMGSWERNMQTGKLVWSDELFRIYGLEPGTVTPSTDYFLDCIVHPGDREQVAAFIDRIYRDHSTEGIEFRLLPINGEERIVYSKPQITHTEQETIIRGIVKNITESKIAERKLQDEHQRMAEAQQIAHIGSWEWNITANTLSWTDEMYRIFGIDRDEDLSFSKIAAYHHPDDIDCLRKLIHDTRISGKPFDCTYRIIRPDGELRHVYAKAKTDLESDGKPMRIRGTMQDITEKKLAEEKLKESQHLLRQIAEATPDILSVFDMQQQKILYVNRDVFQVFGQPPVQLSSSHLSWIYMHLHPEDHDKMERFRKNLLQSSDEQVHEVEYRVKNIRGEWTWFRERSKVFRRDASNQPSHYISITQDITGKVKAEEDRTRLKLRQQQEILNTILHTQEEERKRIGEALHNGLGQVLYAIRLSLEVLEPDTSSPLRDNRRIQEDIKGLLEEAIAETRTLSFELMPTILEDFGLEVSLTELINKKFSQSGIHVLPHFTGFSERLPLSTEVALFRIVQELLNNVMKHSAAASATLSVEKTSTQVSIWLKDDGIGFDTKSVSSSGLGLSSIKNRVKLLNGQFSIKSRKGKGATVSVTVPVE